jgi:uncharacterized membrane protein YczE
MSITDFFNFMHGIYTSLPWLVQELLYIVFIIGLVRRYIGKDIETEVDKRGWFRDGLVHSIVRHFKQSVERYRQIYAEELTKAKQSGNLL